jgi:hypothetical protein
MDAQNANPTFPQAKKSHKIIPANSFAGAYRSGFTKEDYNEPLFPLLEHVNCSYLSSPRNRAPTLLNLKQHAQALTVLIRHLSISTTSGTINNGKGEFKDNEAFDWLNDLETPYTNEEQDHNKGLTSVLNKLRHGLKPAAEVGDEMEQRDICPMEQVHTHDIESQKILPFAAHYTLAKHANEILERLDHEFSSHGGLLGMLPMHEDDKEAVRLGENTILGQMIAFIRALVLRIHEIEIAYAQALDIVAGEAVVPRELLSEVGAVGRLPTVETLMQDQFIMCTVKSEHNSWLKRKFEENEQTEPDLDRMTYVELPTRYYRLKGRGVEKTVFIVPQWEGNAMTRAMEQRPTVIQVTKPQYPVRVTEWEEKHKAEYQRLTSIEPDLWAARSKIRELEEDMAVLAQEKKQLEMEKRVWHLYKTTDPSVECVAEAALAQARAVEAREEKLKEMMRDLEEREEKLREKEEWTDRWVRAEVAKWRERNMEG